MNRRIYLLITVVAASLASGLIWAAEEPPDEAFFETVDVNVVNIEVFVTDKKGNPIKGLDRDDFELRENGRPVVISNFYAMADGRPVESGDPRELESGERAPTRLPSIPAEQRLHLVVYIDNTNIEPFHRNRIFYRVREFLHRLDSEDRVMLVSYERSLHIRHRFTDRPSEIATALFELEKMTGGRLQNNRERQDFLSVIDRAKEAIEVMGRARQHASSIQNDLRFTIDALRDMMVSLAGLPGRKALLYVSDGLEMIPGRDIFFAIQRKFEDMSAAVESQQFSAVRDFQRLATQANSSGVSFYTVDASGLQSLTSTNAEHGRASTIDGGAAFADDMRADNLQSSIQYIAERTGGTAIVNVNDIGRGLEKVSAGFETYYSLGYSPAHSGDGRYYDIEVKTKDKSHRVRHRDGYRDKPASQRMSERTASSLRYGAQSNPLEIRLLIGRSMPHENGNFVVPFEVQVPLAKVELIPRGDLHQGKLEIFFTTMDERGEVSEVQRDEISLEIPSADLARALAGHYTFEAQLLMEKGRHLVGAGIRDRYTASSSFVSQPVVAGAG